MLALEHTSLSGFPKLNALWKLPRLDEDFDTLPKAEEQGFTLKQSRHFLKWEVTKCGSLKLSAEPNKLKDKMHATMSHNLSS